MNEKKKMQADLMLIVVTLCWGVSYYLMDISLADMDPFTLNAHRFLGAFFIAAALTWKKVKNVNKITLKYSVLVGISLVFVYIGATFGVKYTSLSNSGFLCAMTVVFTPLISRVVLKEKQDRKVLVSVLMCFIGIAFLTLKDDFSINMGNLKGDLLCLMCAFAYAIDLLLTEKAVSHKEVNAYQMGVFQLGVTGVCNFVLALIFEQPHFPTTTTVWGAVLFLAIFCTGVAFVVQPIAQQYTTAAHTGVIYALEPVFAAIVAVVFAHEFLSPKSYFGAFLMVASVMVMEIDFGSIRKKKKSIEG
ncbi:MAG: DMT family transporter [Anaerovoracaceae bacterium]